MKRRLASLVQPMAAGLALLFLLFPASCSKDQVPVGPDHTVSGSKSPPSATATLSPSQGAVVLKSGVSLSQFLNANDLVLVTTLPNMPAVGGFPARWYYCVRTEDGSNFADKTGFASFTASVDWFSDNSDVRLTEDDIPNLPVGPDRDGLTFDDVNNPKYTVTEYLEQDAFAQIGLAQARTVSEGDPSTVIAVLDTGIDTSHPLFQSSPALSYQLGGNYIVMPPTGGVTESSGNSQDDDQDAYVDDGEGHGTFVAGLIYTAARQATIRVYKVLNDEGLGTIFGLAKAIRAAEQAGVEVISLSVGTLENNEMLHHVIAQAVAQGIVVVTSAGTKNVDLDDPANLQYPAAWPEVVTVSAVDVQDVKYVHANHGSVIDLVAPGVDVISAIPSVYYPHRYASTSGTSVAVPWISGTIAAVMEAQSLSATQAYDVLYHDVDVIQNPGYELGRGRLNMASAVGYVPPPKP
jgi:hypothetical protein